MNSPVQVAPGYALRVFVAVVLTVGVLRYAQEVFVPLALAILMTFLLAPLVERLQRWHINRGLAVILSVTLTIVILGLLAWVVIHQFTDLVSQLPSYQRQLRRNLLEMMRAVRGGVSDTTFAVEQLTRELNRVAPEGAQAAAKVPKVVVVPPPETALQSLKSLVEPLLKPFSTAALVVVFVIFMLLRLPDLRDRVIRLLGSRNLRVTTEALDEAAKKVSQYIVMQTVINGWQGIATATGLYLIGVPNSVLWGALSMALRFVPYVGIWVAAALPTMLSFAIFDDLTRPALVVALFLALELFSYLVLEPWLYGSRTGVSPIALLVAAAFWTWLWGPIGLLLAIPITVLLVVMGKHIPQLGFLHVLMGDQPVLHPHERLYQRLLASNRDEADDLLDDAMRTQSRVEVCDTVILPALRLAQDDHDRGILQDAKRLVVFEHIERWAEDFAQAREVPRAPPGDPTSPAFGASVLCVPAEDQADQIASRLLVALLLEQGVKARLISGELTDEARPDAIVLSALPPDPVTAARRCAKALRNRWDDVPIIAGLWGMTGDLERPRQRLAAVGAPEVCTSFAECMALLEIRFASAKRELPPLSEPSQAAASPT
ncbi:MAG TPA: AI-2E family transporter [Steroidobacteraceae bacterium]|nr:AI-2E family transporter [Steroidobacteraceae bacterium]